MASFLAEFDAITDAAEEHESQEAVVAHNQPVVAHNPPEEGVCPPVCRSTLQHAFRLR